jgi:hypothetical protein
MRNKFKAAALVAAAGALAIAVPAAAHPGNTNHPSSTNDPSSTDHPSGPPSCKTHHVAYIVDGTVTDASGLTVTNNVATGTLVITLTHSNKWAKKDGATEGASKTYTVTGAKVKFDGGTTSVAKGDRVELIGKFPVVRSDGKNPCTPPPSPKPTFRLLVVHPPAS